MTFNRILGYGVGWILNGATKGALGGIGTKRRRSRDTIAVRESRKRGGNRSNVGMYTGCSCSQHRAACSSLKRNVSAFSFNLNDDWRRPNYIRYQQALGLRQSDEVVDLVIGGHIDPNDLVFPRRGRAVNVPAPRLFFARSQEDKFLFESLGRRRRRTPTVGNPTVADGISIFAA